MNSHIEDSRQVVQALWRAAAMPEAQLANLSLTGAEPVMASSFAVGTAAQSSIAAAALAAATIGQLRGAGSQSVSVDMNAAAIECTGYFRINGQASAIWDPIAGLYPCGSPGGPDGSAGWIRLHTNFEHHRDGVLKLLGLPLGAATSKEAVAAALSHWSALEFEQAATDAGMVVAALRNFEQWDAHPHAAIVAAQPLVSIERIGDADPLKWPSLGVNERPLKGLKILDLTRILAGPVCGRTLAAYGAEVMLVNSPKLPNIASIADTSRGKLSTHIELREAPGVQRLLGLLSDAHVFIQGYRPGALATLGFDPQTLAAHRPGIVCVSLSAYGDQGPWAGKRGFDSLVQTATGFNDAEGRAAGESQPKAMPVQVLDYATGFLMAFGAQAALYAQASQGGSWHVRVSLARTGLWLRAMGRVADGFKAPKPNFEGMTETTASGFGELVAVRHAAHFSRTPSAWTRPSTPPGSHPAAWPSE